MEVIEVSHRAKKDEQNVVLKSLNLVSSPCKISSRRTSEN